MRVRLLAFAKSVAALLVLASLALPWSTCAVSGTAHRENFNAGIGPFPFWVLAIWPVGMAFWQLLSRRKAPLALAIIDLAFVALLGLTAFLAFALFVGLAFGARTPLYGVDVFLVGVISYVLLSLALVLTPRSSRDQTDNGAASPGGPDRFARTKQ